MAKKKKKDELENLKENEKAPTLQPITETLEKNYMPYAMSAIISRALPEIDGFKPSHRKLLFTMYKMGLLKGDRVKSANIVGRTMQLNPHGDASIYETMVRLTRGNEALLHPFIDSKGSFGKQYSRDMAYAASRYTEAKLDPFCHELFSGIDKNAVDFMPNYDNTQEEPTLLPTTFPNVLVSPNLGIAVGMACSICSFNLAEICDGTIALLKNPGAGLDRILDIIKAPDFPGGAEIIYDREQMRRIYETGAGSFKMRAKYEYVKKDNCIDVLQIPYSSCIESIMKKATDMIRSGKLREVTDVRDAIDLNGFKLTFDLRKDADPEIVMQKLFSATELENNFDCNFNILVDGTPMQLGIREILTEWIRFRIGCVSREMRFDLEKKESKLDLLLGLPSLYKLLVLVKLVHDLCGKLVECSLRDHVGIDRRLVLGIEGIRILDRIPAIADDALLFINAGGDVDDHGDHNQTQRNRADQNIMPYLRLIQRVGAQGKCKSRADQCRKHGKNRNRIRNRAKQSRTHNQSSLKEKLRIVSHTDTIIPRKAKKVNSATVFFQNFLSLPPNLLTF